jgi:hypothetical protein
MKIIRHTHISELNLSILGFFSYHTLKNYYIQHYLRYTTRTERYVYYFIL